MTTPTQAQIEAAAKAIRLRDSTDEFALARAALTAAAQVGEPDDGKWKPTPYSEFLNKLHTDLHLAYEQLEAATIERCAQVVKEWHGVIEERDLLLARLDKMKDEPDAFNVHRRFVDNVLKDEP